DIRRLRAAPMLMQPRVWSELRRTLPTSFYFAEHRWSAVRRPILLVVGGAGRLRGRGPKLARLRLGEPFALTAAPDFHSGLPRWRVAINASGWVWDALAPLVDSAAVACCPLQEAVQLDEPTDLVVYETDPLEEDQLQAALSAPGLLTASCLFLGKPPSLQDPRRQSETLQAKDGDAVAEAVARLLGAPHEAGLAPAPVSDDEPPAQTEQPLVAPEAPPPPTFATSG